MDEQGFREFGKAMIDFVADYMENIRERNVLPDVQPGYLSQMLPNEAPEKGEIWQDVMKDIERVIMPGVTHWMSPNFHAYYPTGSSYPSIVGEILSSGLGVIGFSWMSSPACTELEVVTMNWLGKMMDLPKEYLNCSNGPGGGILLSSASEAILVALLAARDSTVRRMKKLHPEWDEDFIRSKLIAYSSDQSNSCVEKAGILAAMKMRLLPVDEKCSLRGKILSAAFEEDIIDGFIPCFVCATSGTTGTCAFDNLNEIGPVCNENSVWLHIDAAYAGAAMICPEYRQLFSGIEHAESFCFNPHKWLLTNFECSAFWVKDATKLVNAFDVQRIYLAHENQGVAPDYRHWQIALGRRFKSLKLWFVLRLYGIEGLQNHVRKQIQLAKHFEECIRSDERLEVILESFMGLVCFRMKGDDSLTQKLVDKLTEKKRIFIIRAMYREKLIIRYAVCSRVTNEKDNDFAWKEILHEVDEISEKFNNYPKKASCNETNGKKEKLGDIETSSKNFELESKLNSQNKVEVIDGRKIS